MHTVFTRCKIICIVKNKAGNFNDANNYSAVALSNYVTKIFEFILYDKLMIEHLVDVHQFMLSAGLSTTMS